MCIKWYRWFCKKNQYMPERHWGICLFLNTMHHISTLCLTCQFVINNRKHSNHHVLHTQQTPLLQKPWVLAQYFSFKLFVFWLLTMHRNCFASSIRFTGSSLRANFTDALLHCWFIIVQVWRLTALDTFGINYWKQT